MQSDGPRLAGAPLRKHPARAGHRPLRSASKLRETPAIWHKTLTDRLTETI